MEDKIIILDEDNIDNYRTDIEYYIQDELGYYNNSHIDYMDIDEDNNQVIANGVFRCEEPDDWDTYEEEWFPDDEDSLFINKQELEKWLENGHNFYNK